MVDFVKFSDEPGFVNAPVDVPVDTSLETAAGALSRAGRQAAEFIREERKTTQLDETEASISRIAEEIGAAETVAAAGGTFNENLEPVTPAGEPLQIDEEVQRTLDRLRTDGSNSFKRIVAKQRQGVIPQVQAQLEVEAEVRRLSGETPGFADEIRQLARDLTGFDPVGVGLQRLFAIPDSEEAQLTPLERSAEGLYRSYQKAGTPISKQDAFGLVAQQFESKARLDIADANLKQGQINFDEWLGMKLQAFVPNLFDLGSALSVEVQRSGGLNAAQTQAYFAGQKQQAINALQLSATQSGRRLLPEDFDKIREKVDALYAGAEQFAADTDRAKLFSSHLDELAAFQRVQGAKAFPILTFLTNNFGAGPAIEYLGFFKGVDSQFIQRQLEAQIPGLAEVVAVTEGPIGQELPKRYNQIFMQLLQGQTISPDQQQLLPGLEQAIVSKATPEVRSIYGEAVSRQGMADRALDIINTKRAVTNLTDAEQARARRSYRTHGTTVDRLAEDVAKFNQQMKGGTTSERLGLFRGQFAVLRRQTPNGPEIPVVTRQTRHLNQLLKGTDTGLSSVAGVTKEDYVADVMARYNRRAEELAKGQAENLSELVTGQGRSDVIKFEVDPNTGELTEIE